jgi:succinate dehydrogenase / fumarate reductase iron-sulfur subunit
MADVLLRVFRGTQEGGSTKDFKVPLMEGMVVLDALHYIQANYDGDLAVRWNCKAAKCGSCSAEVNGKPRLTCKTRIDSLPQGEPITVYPMKAFPLIKDLVTDVSWNYQINRKIPPFTPSKDTDWTMYQEDIDRIQEFRKCIECFLCQNVCHVLREHDEKRGFYGPRFMIRIASLEMHPKDIIRRTDLLKGEAGVGYCNITKCCTEVCPEDIHITDNGIIPLKERMADDYFDPIRWVVRKFVGK